MASNVSGIGANGGSFGVSGNKPKNNEAPKSDMKSQETAVPVEQKNIPAEDVLAFLDVTNNSLQVQSNEPIDVASYVTPEQAERITAGIMDFEDMVATNLQAIASEFPNLSEEAQMELALKMMDEEML